jgi:hypothetical protein
MKSRQLRPVILVTWEAEIRRIVVQEQPAWSNTSQDPISKINRAKWSEVVAQVVERLQTRIL